MHYDLGGRRLRRRRVCCCDCGDQQGPAGSESGARPGRRYVSERRLHTLQGAARFVKGPALAVEGERLEASHYLVATGASAWEPSVPGLDEAGCLTSTTAIELGRLPEPLVVVGGNYVGLELGQLFARLGPGSTLVEALPAWPWRRARNFRGFGERARRRAHRGEARGSPHGCAPSGQQSAGFSQRGGRGGRGHF
jgi:hypothetical protein